MSLDMKLIEEGLTLLSQGKNLPLMPNIPLPTLGGLIFWNELKMSMVGVFNKIK